MTDRTDGPSGGLSRRRMLQTVAAGSAAAWTVPRIASAETAEVTASDADPPPPVAPDDCDLTRWIETGPDDHGVWDVDTDASGFGTSVFQSINGEPTYFVSPELDSAFTFEGWFRVNDSDDDLIGFVFGYTAPLPPSHQDDPTHHDYVLFDWKQTEQEVGPGGSFPGSGFVAEEGFHLSRVEGSAFDDLDPWEHFWAHTNDPANGFSRLASDTGAGKGWVTGTEYAFRLEYGPSSVKIWRKASPQAAPFPTMTDTDKVFDVSGTFPTGRLGFYNFSQAGVRYWVHCPG